MSNGISNFINLKNFLENKRGEAGYNIRQNFIYFSFEFRGFLEKRGNYCIGVTFKRLFSETQAFKTSETANQAALASTQRAKPRGSALDLHSKSSHWNSYTPLPLHQKWISPIVAKEDTKVGVRGWELRGPWKWVFFINSFLFSY